MVAGDIPPPPIAQLLQFDLVEADPGRVVFTCTPDASAYNPIGAVHGGLVCTLLDSVAGCALHSTLPAGRGYTSIEIKVSYLKAVRLQSGRLTAVGTVVKAGSRVAFTEGVVTDASGRGRSRPRPARCWSSTCRAGPDARSRWIGSSKTTPRRHEWVNNGGSLAETLSGSAGHPSVSPRTTNV